MIYSGLLTSFQNIGRKSNPILFKNDARSMFDDKANDSKEKEYQNVTNMEMEESGSKGMFAFLKLYPLEITLNKYENILTNAFNQIYFSEHIRNTSLHFSGDISTNVNILYLSQVNTIFTTYHNGNTTEPPLGKMLSRNTAFNINYIILYTEYVIFLFKSMNNVLS